MGHPAPGSSLLVAASEIFERASEFLPFIDCRSGGLGRFSPIGFLFRLLDFGLLDNSRKRRRWNGTRLLNDGGSVFCGSLLGSLWLSYRSLLLNHWRLLLSERGLVLSHRSLLLSH